MRLVEYAQLWPEAGSSVEIVRGEWGERDWTGKREFIPDDGTDPLYLFDDEILSDEED